MLIIFAHQIIQNAIIMSLVNTTYEEIKQRAENVGLSIAKLCREADISESTVQRWRVGATDPLRTMRAIDDVLRRYEAANE